MTALGFDGLVLSRPEKEGLSCSSVQNHHLRWGRGWGTERGKAPLPVHTASPSEDLVSGLKLKVLWLTSPLASSRCHLHSLTGTLQLN